MRLVFLTPTLLRDRPTVWALWQQQRRYALIVGIFSPVSYVLVLFALQVAPLSHVAPAREVSMLFAALLGGHLLGESRRRLSINGIRLPARVRDVAQVHRMCVCPAGRLNHDPLRNIHSFSHRITSVFVWST